MKIIKKCYNINNWWLLVLLIFNALLVYKTSVMTAISNAGFCLLNNIAIIKNKISIIDFVIGVYVT